MAKVLQWFGFGRNPRESFWDKYLDGQVWLIPFDELPGGDKSHSRNSAHVMAKKRGKKIRTQFTEDGLVMQAYDSEKP